MSSNDDRNQRLAERLEKLAQQRAAEQAKQAATLANREQMLQLPQLEQQIAEKQANALKLHKASKALKGTDPKLAKSYEKAAKKEMREVMDLRNTAKDRRGTFSKGGLNGDFLDAPKKDAKAAGRSAEGYRNAAAALGGGGAGSPPGGGTPTPAVGGAGGATPPDAGAGASHPAGGGAGSPPAGGATPPGAGAGAGSPPGGGAGSPPAAGGAGAGAAAAAGTAGAAVAAKIGWGEVYKKAVAGSFTANEWEKDIGRTKRSFGRIVANFSNTSTAGKIGRGIGLGAVIVAGGKGVLDLGSYVGEKLGMLDPKVDPSTGKPVPADMGKLVIAASELGGAAFGTYLLALGGGNKAMTPRIV